MIKIGFAGCPGTGKTSTSRALASFLRRTENFKKVELVPEYARRYLSKFNIEHMWEQLRIFEKQLEWEDSVPTESLDLLITDAPIFAGWTYALEMKNPTDAKENMLMNDLFKKMNRANCPKLRYDIIFYLPPVLEAVKDGVRPETNFDPAWRSMMDFRLRNTFDIFPPIHFVEINAVDMKERVDECIAFLEKNYAKNM